MALGNSTAVHDNNVPSTVRTAKMCHILYAVHISADGAESALQQCGDLKDFSLDFARFDFSQLAAGSAWD
eukprot:5370064-Amphidinium_carterae.1